MTWYPLAFLGPLDLLFVRSVWSRRLSLTNTGTVPNLLDGAWGSDLCVGTAAEEV